MQFSLLELYVIPSIYSVDIMESGLTQKELHPEQQISTLVLDFVESLEFQDEGKDFIILHQNFPPLIEIHINFFLNQRIAFSYILEEHAILPAHASQGMSAIPDDNSHQPSAILEKDAIQGSAILKKNTVQGSAILDKDTIQGSAILKKEEESHTETGLF